MTFGELARQVVQHYEAGDYAAALAVAEQEGPNFPEKAWDVTYWRLCLLSRQGRVAEAVQVLSRMVDGGSWIGAQVLRQDSDLDVLQGLPEFERLCELCEERRAKAQAEVQPYRLTLEPEGAAAAPLLLHLHGNGSSAGGEVDWWRPLAAHGWRVALTQSTQVDGPDKFIWNDREWAEQEVRRHFEELVKERPAAEGRLLLSGFSRGGGTAIWLAVTGALPAQGFLGIAPSWPDVEALKPYLEARRLLPSFRGYIVIGEADVRCYEMSRRLKALLEEYGVPVELEVHPGMGHVYPEDFPTSLDRALAFLGQ